MQSINHALTALNLQAKLNFSSYTLIIQEFLYPSNNRKLANTPMKDRKRLLLLTENKNSYNSKVNIKSSISITH